ncbi:THO complex subunit 6 [Glycine max]|nr:THO complex subunit 6 [Glycine max]KAH1201166.1 THO complex subunit 6 [Glycine max]
MCGDATNWDEDAYRETILKEREIQTRTVFRTAWAPPYTSNLDTLILASSDGSVASYSISSSIAASKIKNPFGFVNADTDELLAEPNCFVQAHDGPAYDVRFYGDGEDALLLSCGDDGRIRGWRWNEFSSSNYSVSSQGNDIKPVLDVVNPQHKGPWGALSPIPENNAIAVNTQGGSVFAASGDSCAYCWDVETGKVKMVFKGHMDYLHCIVARNSLDQIITGSEDGTTRIWELLGTYVSVAYLPHLLDCKSGKCTQVIDPARDLKLKGSASWVGCVALDASESWLACSSGRNISLWNLPASECISKIPTRACVQDMLFDNNQILTVGTDPLLNRFDMNGTILSQIQCAPSSSFSISLHPAGVMAVGGYGCLVDVISQFGSHMCTFHCQCF